MITSRPAFSLALSLSLMLSLTAGAVQAATDGEEVVATARASRLPTEAEIAAADAKAKAERTTKPANTPEQVIASLSAAPRLDRNAPAAEPAAQGPDAKGLRDKLGLSQVHGTAGVSVGTNGYRSAYVTSVIPVGETGLLGIAVSQTDYGKNRVYGYGYDDYGYGYGYGSARYGRPSGWDRRGGTSTNFGLSLDMNARNRADDIPDDCAPGFRDGDRYIEPVWVTRMNGHGCGTAEQP